MRDEMTLVTDNLSARMRAIREGGDLDEVLGVRGHVAWRLLSEDGDLLQEGETDNLVTTYGDEWVTKRLVGTAVGVVTGMRLGTGTTAASKSGAGAAIVTYTTASSVAIDGGFPTTAAIGTDTGWRATYRATWAAGVATVNGLAEAVLTNEAPLTNVAGAVGNSVARALLSPVVNKGASDTLELTWRLDHLAV